MRNNLLTSCPSLALVVAMITIQLIQIKERKSNKSKCKKRLKRRRKSKNHLLPLRLPATSAERSLHNTRTSKMSCARNAWCGCLRIALRTHSCDMYASRKTFLILLRYRADLTLWPCFTFYIDASVATLNRRRCSSRFIYCTLMKLGVFTMELKSKQKPIRPWLHKHANSMASPTRYCPSKKYTSSAVQNLWMSLLKTWKLLSINSSVNHYPSISAQN